MTTKTLAWDAATYLETPEDVAEYLAAAFETGDLEEVTHALSTIARAHGMTEIARTTGLARGSLYKAIGEGGGMNRILVLGCERRDTHEVSFPSSLARPMGSIQGR